MIYDTLASIGQYLGVHKKLDKAILHILAEKYKGLDYGVYEEEEFFFNVQDQTTKLEGECSFEDHLEHVDIHLIESGEETIGVSMQGELREAIWHNKESDCRLFDLVEETSVKLNNERFAMFFPKELHKPLISEDKVPRKIKKIVYKVKIK